MEKHFQVLNSLCKLGKEAYFFLNDLLLRFLSATTGANAQWIAQKVVCQKGMVRQKKHQRRNKFHSENQNPIQEKSFQGRTFLKKMFCGFVHLIINCFFTFCVKLKSFWMPKTKTYAALELREVVQDSAKKTQTDLKTLFGNSSLGEWGAYFRQWERGGKREREMPKDRQRDRGGEIEMPKDRQTDRHTHMHTLFWQTNGHFLTHQLCVSNKNAEVNHPCCVWEENERKSLCLRRCERKVGPDIHSGSIDPPPHTNAGYERKQCEIDWAPIQLPQSPISIAYWTVYIVKAAMPMDQVQGSVFDLYTHRLSRVPRLFLCTVLDGGNPPFLFLSSVFRFLCVLLFWIHSFSVCLFLQHL